MLKTLKEQYLIVGILAITALVYIQAPFWQFTNWDDTLNVTENSMIKGFSAEGLKTVFSTSFIGMYVPLTMISYMLDYTLAGQNPHAFHFTNLLLHLINILLLFKVIKQLGKSTGFAALLSIAFALHPMNVESVAWVSGRSSLLYSLFLLLASSAYLKHIKTGKTIFLSCLFFLFALLSKSSAIVFPFILLGIDWYLKQKINFKNKVPFIVLALVFGIITLYLRTPVKDSMVESATFSFVQRLVLGCYSLFFYVGKCLLPSSLCIYYPYPQLDKSSALPLYYYLFPAMLVIVGVLVYRTQKQLKNEIIPGLFWFVFPLLIVSQIIPFESINFVADRYFYFSGIGLFWVILVLIEQWLVKDFFKANQWLITAVVVILVLGLMSYNRNKVWKNSITLFTDMINKNITLPYPYHSRGHEYFLQNKLNEALADFTKAIDLKPDYFEANYNRGLVRYALGDVAAAAKDFDKAISIYDKEVKVYYSRGLAHSALKQYDAAIKDFELTISKGYISEDVYINLGNAYYNLSAFEKALMQYEKAVVLNVNNTLAWDHIGPTKYNLKDFAGAEAAYTKSIELKTAYKDAYRDRGIIRGILNNYQGAIDDFTTMLKQNPNDAAAYYNRGLAYQKKGDMALACADWRKAVELGFTGAANMLGLCK